MQKRTISFSTLRGLKTHLHKGNKGQTCILLGLFVGLNSCLDSPLHSANGRLMTTTISNISITAHKEPNSASTLSTAGTLALSLGTQMISKLAADLGAAGLTPEQIAVVTDKTKADVNTAVGKVSISTLWNSFDLAEPSTQDIAMVIGSAVAKAAVGSLGDPAMGPISAGVKQIAVGTMSSSVMSSLSLTQTKLGDTALVSVAGSVIDTLVRALPNAGFTVPVNSS